MTNKERLLKEAIGEILLEDDGYGDLYLSDAMYGPYGAHFASPKTLYAVFIKPFTDVFKVAAGATKEISQRAMTLAHVAFESLVTVMIPVLRDSFDDIFANERKAISTIRQQYAQVYADTWEAFMDNDVLVAAFMYRPDLLVTGFLAKKSPLVAARLLSVLTGGKLDNVIEKVRHRPGKDFNHVKVSDRFGFGGEGEGLPFESTFNVGSRIVEDKSNKIESMYDLVNNEKVQKMLRNSDVVKDIARDGQKIVNKTLDDALKHARFVLSANNLQQLQSVAGKPIPELEKLKQIPENERNKAEKTILDATKNSLKELYIKMLSAQIKTALSGGVPENHPLVQRINDVLTKIKTM